MNITVSAGNAWTTLGLAQGCSVLQPPTASTATSWWKNVGAPPIWLGAAHPDCRNHSMHGGDSSSHRVCPRPSTYHVAFIGRGRSGRPRLLLRRLSGVCEQLHHELRVPLAHPLERFGFLHLRQPLAAAAD